MNWRSVVRLHHRERKAPVPRSDGMSSLGIIPVGFIAQLVEHQFTLLAL